jgi:tRNA (guanine10-N2)-dimethyltransferase
VYVLELVGEDDAFAAREAASVASDVDVIAPGLATARGLGDGFAGLALTRRASEWIGQTDADLASARALLEAASIDRSGTVAVRARDVRSTTGVSTQAVERALGAALVDRGFAVDLEAPDHELRALCAGEVCVLGWLAGAPERDFTDRQPTDRPFFQPGSMDPMLARALVNVAGAREGATVLDPMCGTGGLLIEAGLVGADVIGLDALDKMVRGSRTNLDHVLDGGFDVVRGDATRLPFVDSSADAVVFDAPYGRQTKIEHATLDELVRDALAEARRVAPRAVVVGDRSWREPAEAVGWAVESTFQRRVHRSLDRYVHVLE